LRTRIKICGLSSTDIAHHAALAGADAIGLMFYERSSRYISIELASTIPAVLPSFVSSVGVFVDPDPHYVEQVLSSVKLDYLQFHGDEDAQFCRSFSLPYIKVIRVRDSMDLKQEEGKYPDASSILLDTFSENSYGGTGESFDWGKSCYGGSKSVLLAGGLTPENVADALKTASPYGVDVSSGVETNGVKDKQKITEFCRNVLNADR
jgi:phosphoribosylanthranilate isomerase